MTHIHAMSQPQEEVLGSGLATEKTGAVSLTHLGKDRCVCVGVGVGACMRVCKTGHKRGLSADGYNKVCMYLGVCVLVCGFCHSSEL